MPTFSQTKNIKDIEVNEREIKLEKMKTEDVKRLSYGKLIQEYCYYEGDMMYFEIRKILWKNNKYSAFN